MSKRKKLDILKRLPNGSVIDIRQSDLKYYCAKIDGKYIWSGSAHNEEDLKVLETLIKALATMYQALELDYEDLQSKESIRAFNEKRA